MKEHPCTYRQQNPVRKSWFSLLHCRSAPRGILLFHPVRQLWTAHGWDLSSLYNDFDRGFLKEYPEMENQTSLNAGLTTDLPPRDTWTCLQTAAEKESRKGIRITWDYSSFHLGFFWFPLTIWNSRGGARLVVQWMHLTWRTGLISSHSHPQWRILQLPK